MNLQNISTVMGVLLALLAIPKAVASLVPPSGTKRKLEFWNEALGFPLMGERKTGKVLFQRDQRLAVLYAKHWAGPARRTYRTMEITLCVIIFGASSAIPFMENIIITGMISLVILEIFWILGVTIFSSISIKVQQNEAKKRFISEKLNNPSPSPGRMQERVKKLRTANKCITWFEAILEGVPVMFSGMFVGSLVSMVVAQNQGDPLFLIITWLGFTVSFIMNVFFGKSFLFARYKKMLITDIQAAAQSRRAPQSSA